MVWRSSVRIALCSLRANKLRSSLTMLGIIIGVAAVIAMAAISSGALVQVEEQFDGIGTNLLVVNPAAQMSRGARLATGSQLTLTDADALTIRHELASVENVAPMWIDIAQVIAGTNNWSTRVYGTTSDYLDAVNWLVAAGKKFDLSDVVEARKVALLGDTVARQLFGEHDPIGQVIRVRKVPMEVIGVLAPKGQNHHGIDRDDVIIVPISTLRSRLVGGYFAKRRLVHSVWVKMQEGADMEQAKLDIRVLLRQRHRLADGREDDFILRELSDVREAREEATRTMTILLTALASISLLVGGIGIMNMMLVSVAERTREIGLRMAVGARRRDILSQFIVESTTLAFAGGLFGILLGVGATLAIGYFADWRTALDVKTIGAAVAVAAATGVFFGVYPAQKAARLTPVDALRQE